MGPANMWGGYIYEINLNEEKLKIWHSCPTLLHSLVSSFVTSNTYYFIMENSRLAFVNIAW